MNHVQAVLLAAAILSASVVSGDRTTRNPQFVPVFSVHDDLHNQITGLTLDIHNRIAAAAHHAALHSIINSGLNGPGFRFPNNNGNTNTVVRPFSSNGQSGVLVTTTSFRPNTPTSTRPFSSVFTTPIRPIGTNRPSSSLNTGRPIGASVGIRPGSGTSSGIAAVGIRPGSGTSSGFAAVGQRPGGGVSASAAAVSTSG